MTNETMWWRKSYRVLFSDEKCNRLEAVSGHIYTPSKMKMRTLIILGSQYRWNVENDKGLKNFRILLDKRKCNKVRLLHGIDFVPLRKNIDKNN